jgi:hypothetical protein
VRTKTVHPNSATDPLPPGRGASHGLVVRFPTSRHLAIRLSVIGRIFTAPVRREGGTARLIKQADPRKSSVAWQCGKVRLWIHLLPLRCMRVSSSVCWHLPRHLMPAKFVTSRRVRVAITGQSTPMRMVSSVSWRSTISTQNHGSDGVAAQLLRRWEPHMKQPAFSKAERASALWSVRFNVQMGPSSSDSLTSSAWPCFLSLMAVPGAGEHQSPKRIA